MTNTLIASDYDLSDHSDEHLRVEPSLPLPGKLFLGIEDHDLHEDAKGTGRYVHIDAGKLRDALDKAVGPREEPEPWEGRKPYRPIDRDRLLRHIEDVEASLTRRNERHEKDQERIRELEAQLADLTRRYSEQGDRLVASYGSKTAREHLQLAWEAAIVPEDGMIHVGEAFLCKDETGIRQPVLGSAGHAIRVNDCGVERRLLEPRVEPSKEDSYRKELESKGLAEWEVQLLIGAREAA